MQKSKINLKDKKLIFAAWNAANKNDNPFQNWYLPLKDTLGEVILFDTARNYFRFGKEKLKENLLNLIKQNKPDYLLVIMIYDELDPIFFQELKIISPQTIILSLFSDDDWRYEDYSRYYCLGIDYPIVNITDLDTDRGYRKDGIKNYSLSLGMNCKLFKPSSQNKVYTVSFVGRPNSSRIEYIKFLLEQGIAVKIWGDGWENYPEISKAYQGRASAEDLVNITNESKINLSFTQGGYGKLQMKGRIFEAAACNAFTLIEHFDAYKKYYIDQKEIIMFKDKEDLLKKIKFYLHHDKKRNEIAKEAYKKTIKKYNKHKELLSYFKNISLVENELRNKIIFNPQVSVSIINKEDFNNEKIISEKTLNSKFVAFSNKKDSHQYKHFLQIYSLEKTSKKVSCCDAYISDIGLPHYLLFKAKQGSVQANLETFQKCLHISQLLVEKEYFLKNIEKFKKYFLGDPIAIPNEEMAFVSIPLVTINIVPRINSEEYAKIFQMKFLDRLYSLFYQKKIFFHPYPYFLAYKALRDKNLRTELMKNILDKKKLFKIKKGI